MLAYPLSWSTSMLFEVLKHNMSGRYFCFLGALSLLAFFVLLPCRCFVFPPLSRRRRMRCRYKENLCHLLEYPQNIYCIHIDKSASSSFVDAVESIVHCLPYVFITKTRVQVIYLHVSTVRAQLNCVKDLLGSSVSW